MSTRSAIGVQLPSGEVLAIYCHCDGYTSYNGRMLVEHYNSAGLARNLVSRGDLFSLGKDAASSKLCVEPTAATLFENKHKFLTDFGSWIEYFYLYQSSAPRGWLVSVWGDDDGEWRSVKALLKAKVDV
jgi:hypothetical protein